MIHFPISNDHRAIPIADLRRLARRRSAVLVKLDRQIHRLEQAVVLGVRRGRFEAVRRSTILLQRLRRDRAVLESISPTRSTGEVQIVVSSWMLADSFRICTATEDEGLHLLVGIEHDGLLVATRIIECDYAHRSVVRATATRAAIHRACVETAEAGHRVIAILHAHPGSGPDANHPSSIDLGTHRLWEGISRVVGGIWSRDGYLRWFSHSMAFDVQVCGAHLERIEDRLWRLHDEEPS